MDDTVAVVHVCTNGACRRNGARATLAELEELANVSCPAGRCTIAEYNCFGLCGRGPNVSIDWSDGRKEMNCGVRSTDQSIALLQRATGVQLATSRVPVAKLKAIRRVSGWEQALADIQSLVDVLDVKPQSQRASAACQSEYDSALARIDTMLTEVQPAEPAQKHLKPLAEAIRRQVVAARAGRSPSPEVEEVDAEDPDTWPPEDGP